MHHNIVEVVKEELLHFGYIRAMLRVRCNDGRTRYYKRTVEDLWQLEQEIDKLTTVNYNQKYAIHNSDVDAAGRTMRLVRLGPTSNYAGQYAVRYKSNRGARMWQLHSRHEEYNHALITFIRRQH